jgi:AcrR family transcriptional regulator
LVTLARVREKQREETRKRLYLAALEVFRRDGVQACRIDDISQKAEVSRATFYFHFPTKEAVLLQLLRESDVPLELALNALPSDVSFAALLDQTSGILADFWEREAELLPDALTVALRNTAALTDGESSQVRVLLAERFRVAAARGELTREASPEGLADAMFSVFVTAMLSWSRTRRTSLREALQVMSRLFHRGVRAE